VNAQQRAESVFAKVQAAAEAIGKDPEVLEALHPRNLDVIIPQLSLVFEEKLRLMVRDMALRFEEGLRETVSGGEQEFPAQVDQRQESRP
jgi:hypothetical protein